MAETLKPGDDGATKGHNVGQITDAVNDAFEKIYATEQDIAATKEKYMDPLTKARTRAWRNLKADTGINRKVLEAHYKLLKMKWDAEKDEEDGPDTIDAMRLTFEAMQKGGQLDWIGVVEQQAAA